MEHIIERVEALIIERLYYDLPADDLRRMDCANDMINALDEDAIGEIKHEVWRMLLHELNYKLMLEMLKDRIQEDSSTEISEEEEEDEEDEEDEEVELNGDE